jgi:hypothetical protein
MSGLAGWGKLGSSLGVRGDVSPAERKYKEAKERILGDLKKAMENRFS